MNEEATRVLNAGNSGSAQQSAPHLNFINGATSTEDEIRALVAARFTYKQWTPEQIEGGKQVTAAAIEFGVAVVKNIPPCAARTRVLNMIEESRMLGNAALTHEGKF